MRKNTPKDHPSILRPPPGTPGGRRGRPEDTELRTRIIPFYATLGFDCYATSARVWAKGVTPGIPDLYVMRPGWGIAFWHEVKTGATRQSQAQRLFEEQCAGSGVPYVLGDLDAAYGFVAFLGFGTKTENGFARAEVVFGVGHMVSWMESDVFAAQRAKWGWKS